MQSILNITSVKVCNQSDFSFIQNYNIHKTVKVFSFKCFPSFSNFNNSKLKKLQAE